MSTTLRIHRGTSTHMSDKGSSIVLQNGELFAEYQDNGAPKLKIGDGSTIYSNLPYITNPIEEDSNKRPKIRYTLLASNWSDSPDTNGYYTYSVDLNPFLKMTYPPNIYIAGADDETPSTSTEEAQYKKLKYCNLVSEDNIIIYAKSKPSDDFYVFIEGDIININLDDYFDPDTHIATESKFLEFLDLGYYSNNLIGYKVKLANSIDYNYGTWIIADVNHDSANTGQTKCYDLISENAFHSVVFNTNYSNNNYRDSVIRTWLNNDFYNGFSSDLKLRIINPNYNSQGTWYNDDYLTIPSKKEVNGELTNADDEGVVYPIFYDTVGDLASEKRLKYEFGTETYASWWTRTRRTDISTNVWFVDQEGRMSLDWTGNEDKLAPVIRIS